eukprot:g62991.t1
MSAHRNGQNWNRKLRSGGSQQCKQNVPLFLFESEGDREEKSCESGVGGSSVGGCVTSRAFPSLREILRGMYQKLGEVVDDLRLTEVWCSVWVASALVLWQTPSPGCSRQLGALLPTYRAPLAASVLVKDPEARLPVSSYSSLYDDYMSRACL